MIYYDRPRDLEVIAADIRRERDNFKPSLSLRYPILAPVIILIRSLQRRFADRSVIFATKHDEQRLDKVLFRHMSPLYRQSRDQVSTSETYTGKVTNLNRAIRDLQYLVIQPGETFSLYRLIGNPIAARGYVPGLQISRGNPIVGIGGGLCQIANLIYWSVIHTQLIVDERHHHSIDIFPDSGRTIPFGTGATLCYPTKDLRFKNTYSFPIQLEFIMTESQLCLKILAEQKDEYKYHISESDHCFFSVDGKVFRTNCIYREVVNEGEVVKKEFMYQNVFPVHYQVEETNISESF
jgi:vancomycin resistance protein VanW